MGDGPRQLCRHGDQEGHFVLGELAALPLPNHQYPQHTAVMDNGYAQETVIVLFAGFGDELITGMIGGVIQIQRFGSLGNQAYQALIKVKANVTY